MNTSSPLPAPKMHPVLLTAALSVSALALAGIGVLTGAIPFAPHMQETPAPQAQAFATPATTAAAQPVALPHAAHKTASHTGKPVAHVSEAGRSGPPDIEVTRADPSHNVRTSVQTSAACKDCGVIESVREVTKQGEATGLGAVAGSVVGGILGNQVGAGHGRDAMTVLGVIGGAVAGHQIEKSQHKSTDYEIVVRFEDGTTRVMTQDTPPVWRQGEHVKVIDGMITAAAGA